MLTPEEAEQLIAEIKERFHKVRDHRYHNVNALDLHPTEIVYMTEAEKIIKRFANQPTKDVSFPNEDGNYLTIDYDKDDKEYSVAFNVRSTADYGWYSLEQFKAIVKHCNDLLQFLEQTDA